jgi:hypothetical protein
MNRSSYSLRNGRATKNDRRRKNRRMGERSVAPTAQSPSALSWGLPTLRLGYKSSRFLAVTVVPRAAPAASGRMSIYRRSSMSVCCIEINISAEILSRRTRQARRAKDLSPRIRCWEPRQARAKVPPGTKEPLRHVPGIASPRETCSPAALGWVKGPPPRAGVLHLLLAPRYPSGIGIRRC